MSKRANVGIGVTQDEMHVFLGAGGRVFNLKILFIQQFINLLFLNKQAPGVRLISRRDPREVQLARTSSEWTFLS